MFRLTFWLCLALVMALFYLGDARGQSAVLSSEQNGGMATTPSAATTLLPSAHTEVTTEATPPSPRPEVEGQVQAEDHSGGIKKTPVRFGTAPAPSLITVAGRDAPAGYVSRSPDGAEMVEVTGSRVNLRSGPSTGTPVVGALTRGTRAEILSRSAGWVELTAEDGQQGFMSAKFVTAAR